MKMLRFLGKRGFAVFTSLVLCTSLVLPSFAASFKDLQNAVRGSGDYDTNAISVKGEGDNRTITLKENIEREGTEGHVTVNASKSGGSVNVTINLAGHTIDGTGGKSDSIFLVTNGSTLTLTDVDEETGELFYARLSKHSSPRGGQGL